ncbi:MAG: hypothetical protein PHF60_00725 [Candidatus ainarchaeum sp.]|nr:hypothetical protein [Candidatus ainarchaeum sp.]
MPKRPSAIRAFASATVLVSGLILGCDRPASKDIEVKCSPCPKCAVPGDATILEKGSTIRAPGLVSVALIANEDGSISAFISGSVGQYAFLSDYTEFDVARGDLCKISVSGKEGYELYKPSAFVTEPIFVSSKTSRL